MRERTAQIIYQAYLILADHHPMTLRQIFYRLVAKHILENNRNRYNSLSRMLVKARQEGMIPWDWIEDRLRVPRKVPMWSGLREFADVVAKAYRRDIWETQPTYCEVWLEKDALSGIFQRVLNPYGVTLNVGRGYDSWSAIKEAADRLGDGTGVVILYFGDFDPSGEDMVRSLEERLWFFGCAPVIEKEALTLDDIERYDLPPDFTKSTDSRSPAFVAKYGDIAVELDALPPDVLAERVQASVESCLDLDAWGEVRKEEALERERLVELLTSEESDGQAQQD